MTDADILAENIVRLRKQRGMSQEALAEAMRNLGCPMAPEHGVSG